MIELCWTHRWLFFFCTEQSVFQTLFCINLRRCVHRRIIRRDFFVGGIQNDRFSSEVLGYYHSSCFALFLVCNLSSFCVCLCTSNLMTGQTFTPASMALWDWQKYCPLLLFSSPSLSKVYDWGARCFLSDPLSPVQTAINIKRPKSKSLKW